MSDAYARAADTAYETAASAQRGGAVVADALTTAASSASNGVYMGGSAVSDALYTAASSAASSAADGLTVAASSAADTAYETAASGSAAAYAASSMLYSPATSLYHTLSSASDLFVEYAGARGSSGGAEPPAESVTTTGASSSSADEPPPVPSAELTRRERQEFEAAVEFASVAIEEAACLDDTSEATPTSTDESTGELKLSYDDWFKLRGLLLCARFGPCEEKWPPWFDIKALRHWQAWKAQGRIAPSEARRRFCTAVRQLPGYDVDRATHLVACVTLVWPFGVPCTCSFSLCGLVGVRFERPPPRTPTLEEAEASRRRALAARPSPGGPPGTLESFVGRWRHTRTDGIEAYLKAFGVSLWRRKAATAFVPHPRYFVDRGRLCIQMSTPIGSRTEWLHPDGPAEQDRDPGGRVFAKTVHWESDKLVSTFKAEDISDVITTRYLEVGDNGQTMLVQQTAFEDNIFTRRFVRESDE